MKHSHYDQIINSCMHSQLLFHEICQVQLDKVQNPTQLITKFHFSAKFYIFCGFK